MKSKWGREVLNFIFYKEDMGDFKMKIFLFYSIILHNIVQYIEDDDNFLTVINHKQMV